MESLLTSTTRNLVGVSLLESVRFVNVQNFNYISINISACREFNCAHTGVNIANKLLSIFKEYGIENKVRWILTDNASNMLKVKSFKSNFVV